MCTSFRIQSTDRAVIVGRSMEFGAEMSSNLVTHPRGESLASTAPGGGPGLAWTSRYGTLAFDSLGLDVAVDGLNEKGLSFHALYYPGFAGYQDTQAAANPARALAHTDFGLWVLGNFATTAEVRASVEDVFVWGYPVDGFDGPPPIHFAVHDASGAGLVIEYTHGELRVFDNEVGVMTNSPPFDWHLINLANYLNLRALSTKPITIAGTVLAPPGQGGGFLGIPGDWTPPSRFVRSTAMIHFAREAATATEGANLALHLLNAVDIPKGDVRDRAEDTDTSDYTQWIVVWDLTNRVARFRTYANTTVRRVDMDTLDLSPGAPRRRLALDGGSPEQNVTAELL